MLGSVLSGQQLDWTGTGFQGSPLQLGGESTIFLEPGVDWRQAELQITALFMDESVFHESQRLNQAPKAQNQPTRGTHSGVGKQKKESMHSATTEMLS